MLLAKEPNVINKLHKNIFLVVKFYIILYSDMYKEDLWSMEVPVHIVDQNG